MNNRDRFYEAFIHGPHQVMGRRLQRLTLRHRLWLEAFDSPLVTGGEASLVDLEMASRVCSIPFEDLEREIPAMVASGPGRFRRFRFALSSLFRSATKEYNAFQAYLLDHGCPPAIHGSEVETVGDGEGDEIADASPLPSLLMLVTGLIRCGWSQPEAVWRLSPGEAEWYLTGGYLHRGVDVKVKSPHDEQFEEEMERLKAEAANAQRDPKPHR